MQRVFVGGIGYRYLRDLSIGPVLLDEMRCQEWPPDVDLEDLGPGGPLATVYNLDERPAYRRALLFGGVSRGREGGRVYRYRWPGEDAPAEEIQARIAEAVTGVISLENTLVIGQHFGIWPRQTVVVEVEPVDENWGDGFSPDVEALRPGLHHLLRGLALAADLEQMPLRPDVALEGIHCGR